MKISVIVIGDELLLGRVADTNSGFIARSVAPLSWQVDHVETVGDNAADMLDAISRAMDRSPIVLTTGGLGPTKDDITKRVLTDYFGGSLRLDPEVLANVEEVMRKRGRELNELTRTQAIVPDSCTVIQNRVGTAPLMWFERPDGHVLVAMPGVPFETEEMFPSEVLPRLLQRFGSDRHISHRSLIVTGYSESKLAETISAVEDSLPPFLHLAYLPNQGYVHLRLDGFHADKNVLERELDNSAAQFRDVLGDAVLWDKDEPLAAILLQRLGRQNLKIATAESCTGGNIAHAITLVPGSSSAMMGGVVAYSNSVKMSVLGVSSDTLELHGAVSEPTVSEMALGAAKRLGADIAVATSGIAGPGGAVPGKPVGTVCIAVAKHGKIVDVRTWHFAGNRQRVINHATNIALIRTILMV